MSAIEYSCNGEVKMSRGAIRAVRAKERNAISRAILIASPRKALIFKASASRTVRSLMNQDGRVTVKSCQPRISPIQCKGRNRTS